MANVTVRSVSLNTGWYAAKNHARSRAIGPPTENPGSNEVNGSFG
jgi:hypothetical protein